MWLKNDSNAFITGISGGFESGRYFARQVGVVLENIDLSEGAPELKPPRCASKLLKASNDVFIRNSQLTREDRNYGGVSNIVPAGYLKRQLNSVVGRYE